MKYFSHTELCNNIAKSAIQWISVLLFCIPDCIAKNDLRVVVRLIFRKQNFRLLYNLLYIVYSP